MANYISSLWIMSIICCQPKSRSTTTVVVVHKYEISTSPWSCPKVGYGPNPFGMFVCLFVCLFVVALFIHTQINKHSQNWFKGEFSRRPQSLIGKPTVPSKRFIFHVFFGTSSHFPNISLTFPQDFPGVSGVSTTKQNPGDSHARYCGSAGLRRWRRHGL